MGEFGAGHCDVVVCCLGIGGREIPTVRRDPKSAGLGIGSVRQLQLIRAVKLEGAIIFVSMSGAGTYFLARVGLSTYTLASNMASDNTLQWTNASIAASASKRVTA